MIAPPVLNAHSVIGIDPQVAVGPSCCPHIPVPNNGRRFFSRLDRHFFVPFAAFVHPEIADRLHERGMVCDGVLVILRGLRCQGDQQYDRRHFDIRHALIRSFIVYMTENVRNCVAPVTGLQRFVLGNLNFGVSLFEFGDIVGDRFFGCRALLAPQHIDVHHRLAFDPRFSLAVKDDAQTGSTGGFVIHNPALRSRDRVGEVVTIQNAALAVIQISL